MAWPVVSVGSSPGFLRWPTRNRLPGPPAAADDEDLLAALIAADQDGPAPSHEELVSHQAPFADDPRLAAAAALIAHVRSTDSPISGLGAQLARQLGIAERTGQRLIAAALSEDPSANVSSGEPD